MDENGVGAAGDDDAAVRVVGAVCAPGVVYAVSVGGVAGVAGVVSFLSFADGGGVAWVSAVGGGCAFGVVSFVGVCGVWVGWVDQDGVEEDAVEQFLQAVRGAVVEAGAVAEQVKEVGHALVEGAAVGVCLGQQAGLACPAGARTGLRRWRCRRSRWPRRWASSTAWACCQRAWGRWSDRLEIAVAYNDDVFTASAFIV